MTELHVFIEGLLVAERFAAHMTYTVSLMRQSVPTKVTAEREPRAADVALERLAVAGLAGETMFLEFIHRTEPSGAPVTAVRQQVAFDVGSQRVQGI